MKRNGTERCGTGRTEQNETDTVRTERNGTQRDVTEAAARTLASVAKKTGTTKRHRTEAEATNYDVIRNGTGPSQTE